jgi:pyruvate kinase
LILAKYKKVKYFAISNVEDHNELLDLKTKLPFGVHLVPKIETVTGVKNLQLILNTGVQYVMLDKDDLWVSCKQVGFNELVDKVREICSSNKAKLLELQGVVFE